MLCSNREAAWRGTTSLIAYISIISDVRAACVAIGWNSAVKVDKANPVDDEQDDVTGIWVAASFTEALVDADHYWIQGTGGRWWTALLAVQTVPPDTVVRYLYLNRIAFSA